MRGCAPRETGDRDDGSERNLFDWNLFEVGGPLLFVVILHTIGLAQLGTLFGAVVSRLNRGEALSHANVV